MLAQTSSSGNRATVTPQAAPSRPEKALLAPSSRTRGARLVEVDDGHELSLSLDRIFEEAFSFLCPPPGEGKTTR